MDRYSRIRGCFDVMEGGKEGKSTFELIQESKVLVVGAGGIGCELLKNLALTGFKDIETIDLDTIDVSNLNRQFLFRRKHVGLSKAQVAMEAAMEFNPDCKIQAYHGNIKEERFGIDYFNKFDVILNALDNVNARQHVNRLCLAAEKPLVDAGTTGYLGQVTVIQAQETQCYDCEPKQDNKKTYPICTIRNTPDKPVHCIVWGKELFKLLFGNMEDSMLSGEDEGSIPPNKGEETNEGNKAGEEEKRVQQEKEAEIRSMIMSAAKRPNPENPSELTTENLTTYARNIFDAVFNNEIKLKLKMRNGYKGAKCRPTPLSLESIENGTAKDEVADSGSEQQNRFQDQRIWTLMECASVFIDCVVKMWGNERRPQIGDMEFNKDDPVALDFVTAASNLRSHVFGIERKSKFDVKGIAGNIIHAIATTNAIVAGIQVLEAVKILQSKYEKERMEPEKKITENCVFSWVVRETVGSGKLIEPCNLQKPNPKCFSCGSATLTLQVDVSAFTLGELVQKVLKSALGVNTPSVTSGSSEIYSEGDGLDEEESRLFGENLPKVLQDAPAGGIKHGTILEVDDFSQNLTFKLIVQHKPNVEFEQDGIHERYSIAGDTPKPKHEEPVSAKENMDNSNGNSNNQAPPPEFANENKESDGEIEIVEVEHASNSGSASESMKARKRRREDDEKASSAKRLKQGSDEMNAADNVQVIELD